MQTFAAFDGTTLAYHEQGHGTPLICLPGGPGRASAYFGDLGGLSAHRRLILLDNRGTGNSAVPEDPSSYRCDRLVDDVEALRLHLGLERLDLLAHSAAGNIATLYAARHPERLHRLVLVAPGWRATDLEFTDEEWLSTMHRRADEPWYADAYAAILRIEAGEVTAENWRAASPFYFGRWSAAAAEFTDTDEAQRAPEAEAGFRVPGAFGDPAETRAALASLTAPVLVIGGELDPAPTVRLLRELTALFPQGRLVIQPDAGHMPWIDDPAAFVATVTGFLAA
ncbi:alpha/beta hydrolase [Micromonospora sp. NPDC049679]|uniref:alpha/beta fold hydrolase n=1 Tax=Micromonospora sp. NPDC049679 TaxID=3155920 RepID=UPI0033DCE3F0